MCFSNHKNSKKNWCENLQTQMQKYVVIWVLTNLGLVQVNFMLKDRNETVDFCIHKVE